MKSISHLKNKFAVYLSFLLILVACNSSPVKEMNANNATSATDSVRNNPAATVTDSEYQTGARLVSGNDCLSCHKIDQKSTGPSYIDIANKYEMNQGNIENLSHKIIVGGYGRWGTASMTPHPGVSEPDAQEMAKYILSLRTSK